MTATSTHESRSTEIAKAFGFDFDFASLCTTETGPTGAQRFVLSLIEEITSTERQIETRRYWIQSNLDRTMGEVNAIDGRPSSLTAVSADELNGLVATLVALRKVLSEAKRTMFPDAPKEPRKVTLGPDQVARRTAQRAQ